MGDVSPLLFTGAPTARVFGNKLYVYASADTESACGPKDSSRPLMEGYFCAPPGFAKTGFCNPGYTVFSTDDPTLEFNWVSKENLLNENQVPWTYKLQVSAVLVEWVHLMLCKEMMENTIYFSRLPRTKIPTL